MTSHIPKANIGMAVHNYEKHIHEVFNKEQPLLSILIPTKNRKATAISAIKIAAMTGSQAEVEVIVQDCSDTDDLRNDLKSSSHLGRVRYFWEEDNLSMVENWNRGMGRVNGEYIIIIGDDDTVSLDILSICKWGREKGYEAICQKGWDNFWWSGYPTSDHQGQLSLQLRTGGYEMKISQEILRDNSSTGEAYQILPSVYHGLIKRKVLEEMRDRAGEYFLGLSPDVYCAYAVTLSVEKFVILDYPFTIVGASKNSNTNRLRMGDISQHFAEYNVFQFNELVPSTPGLYSSMTNDMLEAFSSHAGVSFRKYLGYVDLPRVFARTIYNEPTRAPEHIKKYIQVMKLIDKSIFKSIVILAINITGKVVLSMTAKVRRGSGRVETEYTNCNSIEKAVELQKQFNSSVAPYLADIYSEDFVTQE